MKDLSTVLLSKEPAEEIMMGNYALVRAMIETGTRVVTSYPGSPTPEIASAINSIPKEKRSFYFEFSTNEKVATEVAYGASVNGHLSTVFFKSVGLNVAADTFVQLSLMPLMGGMVIILGDDPGANSSQNEQDNRHYAQMSYTPVFEPGTPQEAYEFYHEAVKLSKQHKMPVILRMTTHVCHFKQKVKFNDLPDHAFDNTPKFNVQNGPYMPLTKLVFPMKNRALTNLKKVSEQSDNSNWHKQTNNESKRGIITFGLPYYSLLDTLQDVSKELDILKLGLVYPLPRKVISNFLKTHKEVFILEELDDIIETYAKRIAFEDKIEVTIHGKTIVESWIGEYTPDNVSVLLDQVWPDLALTKASGPEHPLQVPFRPAQMCPGCGHRSAFYAIKKALKDTDIKVADIGCHTLGFMPPYNMGELLMCMGSSPAIGSGLNLFNDDRRIVCFLGDSTFFHAGLPGIINTVFNKHNITLVVMENGTTAMTGHQNHAATGKNFDEITEKISIRKVLESFGIKKIYETDTYKQQQLTEYVNEAVNSDEFSVIIARHPCMLKLNREQRRKKSYQPRKVNIDQNLCNHSYSCVKEFGCPTFVMSEDGSVSINPDLCIGDGSCLPTCPANAIEKPSVVE